MKKTIGLLILSMLIISVVCSFFGQILLYVIANTENYYKYIICFSLIVLLFTKYINKKLNFDKIGTKYIINNSENTSTKINILFSLVLVINTLLAHATGVSVGREGVAIQVGGAIGDKIYYLAKLSSKYKGILVRGGMIFGFAGLFQTWLAAVIFVIEITLDYKKIYKEKIIVYIFYILLAYLSAYISNKLGLEKFSIKIEQLAELTLSKGLLILLVSVIAIFIGILFVVVQKKLKFSVSNDSKIIWLLFLIFVGVSYVTSFRYSSLGIKLISSSFENFGNIQVQDFIIKLLLTCVCTAIGFSGGEVTPLFAIGASFGVIAATILSLPIMVTAAICYCLVFASSTKTFITPILLAFEVFGLQVMYLIIIPSLLIYFFNKKYSIYQ